MIIVWSAGVVNISRIGMQLILKCTMHMHAVLTPRRGLKWYLALGDQCFIQDLNRGGYELGIRKFWLT